MLLSSRRMNNIDCYDDSNSNCNIVGIIILLLLSSQRISTNDIDCYYCYELFSSLSSARWKISNQFGYCCTFKSNNNASLSASSLFVHQVSCNIHTDYILLLVSPSLTFQVGILDPLLVSSILATVLPRFLQAELCFHAIAITHTMIGPLVVLVSFRPRSLAFLSCNPHAGSRWCVCLLYTSPSPRD